MDPLILTLGFDEAGQAAFEAARRAHYPSGRNRVPAHLTLFHRLPGSDLERIASDLRNLAGRVSPFRYRVATLLDLGGGVAYGLEVPGLAAVHRMLQDLWAGDLGAQDRQALRPHVTVQNKVDRATAERSLAALGARFAPWDGHAPRLDLWHYRGGPWEAARTFDLKGNRKGPA